MKSFLTALVFALCVSCASTASKNPDDKNKKQSNKNQTANFVNHNSAIRF